ncbi:LOW QUALITY PROTEIN: putative disease resistance RPP13-like protein 1 [Durio zibethinus]|uniref:LOW QUALITY PROTEIN: putative disease resistance RPP13-like protein 1 n=1 Tax=Durio zibethinus TaxID=66656 RepID=A0A6P5Z5S8_DURZI|nr:LOW QUALITY PROTEIN: putative disease resistance RPP13-like protein 1 [Durio zibethinus]
MGGIGKTTLAQLVYNDATVHDHFDLKAWVCVSDDFDVTRITKAIFQAVTSKACNDNDLNSLQEKLKELSGKNFLIVLDDVWDVKYHDWTILQSPFLTRTPASKIIVTTRISAVYSTMGASFAHCLEVLSEDDCLSVFAQHALGAKDFEGHPNLKEVAEKIVRKCNGLPLAAKTLGGLARTDIDLDAWEKILESEIWKLSDHRFDIIPALQLSYHHLPPHLKRCFAYCSILPKDYEFQEREIILLWRAEGFLQEARDKHSIEDLGHKYFRDLVSRSLLQISTKGLENVVEPQDALKAKLHDKLGLDQLELMWSDDLENRNREIETKVLDLLHPSKMLKELVLKFYYGVRLAVWIGDSSFNKLLSICLECCPNCTSLPSIGQLPLLKKLCIKGLDNVTSVGVEFLERMRQMHILHWRL